MELGAVKVKGDPASVRAPVRDVYVDAEKEDVLVVSCEPDSSIVNLGE